MLQAELPSGLRVHNEGARRAASPLPHPTQWLETAALNLRATSIPAAIGSPPSSPGFPGHFTEPHGPGGGAPAPSLRSLPHAPGPHQAPRVFSQSGWRPFTRLGAP